MKIADNANNKIGFKGTESNKVLTAVGRVIDYTVVIF